MEFSMDYCAYLIDMGVLDDIYRYVHENNKFIVFMYSMLLPK